MKMLYNKVKRKIYDRNAKSKPERMNNMSELTLTEKEVELIIECIGLAEHRLSQDEYEMALDLIHKLESYITFLNQKN